MIRLAGKIKYFLVMVSGLCLILSLSFTIFARGAADAQDVQGFENLPLTLEEYHDAWVSYLDDRLDYARQQGDERLENAMLWCLEHHTKEEIARWLKEGSLGVRSVAENVIFECEDEWGGIGRFWVGSAEGKEVVRIDPPPIEDNRVYEFPSFSCHGEPTENRLH